MFKFLKEKLKKGIKSISNKIEKEGTTEETEVETAVEEKEEIQSEKKGFFSKLKDKFTKKSIEEIPEEETIEQEVKIKDGVEEYQKKEEIKESQKSKISEALRNAKGISGVLRNSKAISDRLETKSQNEKEKLEKKEKKVKEKVEKKETPKIQELTERKGKEEEIKKKEKEIEEPEEEKTKEKKGFFKTIKEKITTKKISKAQFDKIFWDLEVALLENNVAVEVIEKIKDDLTQEIVDQPIPRGKIEHTITSTLSNSIKQLLNVDSFNLIEKAKSKKPFVICFVGINGSGKTTTIAKVAKLLKDNGLSIVLVAGDTWRQAAIEQIGEWAKKLKVPLIKHTYGSDPAAVAFDGVKMAKSRNIDVVLIDTAGRMHSNVNLTEEMKKIMRVAKPDLKIFVGESITGNDCVEQSKKFDEAIELDGIILSKADIDEKGGAAISISYVTQKPIIYLGTGQELDDLEEFDPSIVTDSLGLSS